MPRTPRLPVLKLKHKKAYGHQPTPEPLRLDLGCGMRKLEGFTGVDVHDFPGVDVVMDLRAKWPWKDDSVGEVHSSHFVEHLTGPERVAFFNNLWRVMAPKATAKIVVPHWSNACAYGDPTHQWPPMSEWFVFYLNTAWRAANAPHTGYTCNFEWVIGVGFDERIMTWNDEKRQMAITHWVNSARDMHVTLTKP